MKFRTRKTRPALDAAHLVLPVERDSEVARFLRPPTEVKESREFRESRVGELAHALLGHRIITTHGAR